MLKLKRPRVKICGITNIDDALIATQAGVDALGFVFYPKSPRYITPSNALEIVKALPSFVSTVGLFMDSSQNEVADIMSHVPLSAMQFHGQETPVFCDELSDQLNTPYLKAIPMNEGLDVVEYVSRFKNASAVLLDSTQFGKAGGSGERFNWQAIPKLNQPVILAGGITPENVCDAIDLGIVKGGCYALDLSSGVEQQDVHGNVLPGQKDANKIIKLMSSVYKSIA